MRFLMTVAGFASLGVAVVLCFPYGSLAWQETAFRRRVRNTSFEDLVTGKHTERQYHPVSETIVSVGPVTLSGWRLWAVAGGLALLGVLIAYFGVYALSSRPNS